MVQYKHYIIFLRVTNGRLDKYGHAEATSTNKTLKFSQINEAIKKVIGDVPLRKDESIIPTSIVTVEDDEDTMEE